MKKFKFRLTIRIKTILMVILFALVLVETSTAYFAIVISNTNKENFFNIALKLSKTTADTIDVNEVYKLREDVRLILKDVKDDEIVTNEDMEDRQEEWETYVSKYRAIRETNEFKYSKDYVARVANANTNEDDPSSDIDCVYLVYVDVERELFVYLADSAPIDDGECPPGSIDPIVEINREIFTNPARGFPPYITDFGVYGWLVTAGSPIYKDGEVIAYALVDISMYTVRNKQANNITNLFFVLLIAIVSISIAAIIVVHFVLVRPMRRLNKAALSYDTNEPEKTHEIFSNLTVKTKDELEDLAKSMRKMEEDVHNKINELTQMNKELVASQQQTKKMTELANRDGLTGVQNKIAYNAEVERINSEIKVDSNIEFGIVMIDLNYLKSTNDDYGHDAGDQALKKLSNLICNIFDHSPVYRIGGDEFVVILRKRDYNNAEYLVKEFNNEIDKIYNNKRLNEKERISAALGYSVFNKETDKCVDDVFKRADKAMYERKHRMKEEK